MDGLAARARHRRAHGDRHAQPRPPSPRRGLGARRSPSRPTSRSRRRSSSRRSSRRCSAARSSRTSRRTSRTSSRRTGRVRIGVVDYGVKNSVLRRLAKAGAAVTVHPARHGRGRARGLRRRPALAGPRRPGAARGRDRDGAAAARPDARARHLPRPPADRARDRPRHVQAPVRPPRREPSGARAADGPRPRHEPEPRLRRERERGGRGRRTSRSTTARSRGSTCRELRARSLQFHPEAGPGPHDAWPLLEAWVEEVADA